jgi:hypothetical protein
MLHHLQQEDAILFDHQAVHFAHLVRGDEGYLTLFAVRGHRSSYFRSMPWSQAL